MGNLTGTPLAYRPAGSTLQQRPPRQPPRATTRPGRRAAEAAAIAAARAFIWPRFA